jgi:arylsulfatase A-like enzyme
MEKPARPPNILLITSDQHRGDCYGFEGRRVKTPHLDAMASSGTRFSACITPNVVCQPSRASILTGLLPLTHGVSDNGIDLPAAIAERGFAHALASSGFATGFIGKAHFSTFQTFQPTGTPECRYSSADYGADWFGPYMGFQHVELMLEGHNNFPPMPPPRGQHYERWFHADGQGEARIALYRSALPPVSDAHSTWNSALPVAWHNSSWIGNETIEYLRTHRDQPFCLWASFPDPHQPFDAPAPWCYLHHPDEVDLPRHRARDLDRRPWWHRASLEGVPQLADEGLRQIREKVSRTPVQTDAQLRALVANYYGMISLVDHQVGRIKIALAELGLADNTLVIFTSDHGEWLGDHGLLIKGPMPYEGLLRVGMLFEGPGVPRGACIEDPVSTLDLAETISEYTGIALPERTHGQSLRGLIEGRGPGREFARSEWHLRPSRSGVELQLQTVRTRRYKLTVEQISGAGELYDLQEDPDEMCNCFESPAYAAVRRELTEMIASRPADRADTLAQVGMA